MSHFNGAEDTNSSFGEPAQNATSDSVQEPGSPFGQPAENATLDSVQQPDTDIQIPPFDPEAGFSVNSEPESSLTKKPSETTSVSSSHGTKHLSFSANKKSSLQHQRKKLRQKLRQQMRLQMRQQQLLQQQEQKLRLQRLQLGRERKHLRLQQEIYKKHLTMRQKLRTDSSLPTSANRTSEQASTTSIDTFLRRGDIYYRSRQESGDSGLGLNRNSSLPSHSDDHFRFYKGKFPGGSYSVSTDYNNPAYNSATGDMPTTNSYSMPATSATLPTYSPWDKPFHLSKPSLSQNGYSAPIHFRPVPTGNIPSKNSGSSQSGTSSTLQFRPVPTGSIPSKNSGSSQSEFSSPIYFHPVKAGTIVTKNSGSSQSGTSSTLQFRPEPAGSIPSKNSGSSESGTSQSTHFRPEPTGNINRKNLGSSQSDYSSPIYFHPVKTGNISIRNSGSSQSGASNMQFRPEPTGSIPSKNSGSSQSGIFSSIRFRPGTTGNISSKDSGASRSGISSPLNFSSRRLGRTVPNQNSGSSQRRPCLLQSFSSPINYDILNEDSGSSQGSSSPLLRFLAGLTDDNSNRDSERSGAPQRKRLCVETASQTEEELHTNKFTQRLHELLQTGQFSDATINVKCQEFKVHKNILVACSPVFAAMMEHDTKEKATGIVDIEDVEPDTFAEFLHCIYSGNIQNLNSENVVDMYVLADKYQVIEIRQACMRYMTNHISLDTFCDIMALSLRYQEKELAAAATKYYLQNSSDVSKTAKWLTFVKENFVAANELFLKALEAKAE